MGSSDAMWIGCGLIWLASACRAAQAPPPEVATTVDVAARDAGAAPPSSAAAPAVVASAEPPAPAASATDDGGPAPLPPDESPGADASGAAGGATSKLLGKPAPAIVLSRVGGTKGQVSLAKQKKKVTIVHFFATWEMPSRKAIAAYAQTQTDIGSDKVTVIAVSVDELEDGAAVADYATRLPSGVLVVHDQQKAVVAAYAPERMPSTYVVDASGVIRFVLAGFGAADGALVKAKVQELSK